MILAIIFAVYLIGMASIGVYCTRFNKDLDDFVLGGRQLGPWVAAFSAQASDFSGWLLIALPAFAYTNGLSAVWTCIGCSLGVMFNWMVLAPRMRRMSIEHGSLTIPDLLEARFGDTSRLIRILSVGIILVFYASYISAQFVAAGKVFDTAFAGRVPWSQDTWSYYHQGLIIGMVVILGYTAMGGFLAVCWTDFVQAILMVTAVVVLPIVGVIHLGGFEALWSAMLERSGSESVLSVSGGKPWGFSLIFGVVLSGLKWSVGYPGQPHIVVRYMAIDDSRNIAKGTLIAVVWSLVALYGAMFVGLVARAVVSRDLAAEGLVDSAMPILALQLLPTALAGVMLSAAVAAMMSTVDSQIIIAVGAVVRDVYEKLLGGHPSGRVAVWLSRLVIVVLGIAGITLAWEGESVFAKVLDAWGSLSAGLGPAIVLACVWKRTSRAGIIVGMIAGVLLTQFWTPIKTLFNGAGGSWSAVINYLDNISFVVCFAVNMLLVVVISLVLGPPADRNARSRAEAV